jgi:outer membrane lipoprotein-sorting protein
MTRGKIFMKTLLLVSLVGLMTLTSWAATNPVPLTATQVLDEFAKTQDRLLSVAYTATTTEEVKKGNRFYVAEVRTDANRAASRERSWGPGTLTSVSQADPYNYTLISDGNARVRYSARGKRPGTLNIAKVLVKRGSPDSARRAILTYNNAGYLFGRFSGDEDRCDIVLRNASELRVRNQPEKVNGVPCLVLEARRTHDDADEQYALWFDPAHGYNIARADMRVGPKGESPAAVFRLNQVGFRQVDGIWVPVSAEADSWQRNTHDGSTASSRIHVRITAIRVNPKDEPVNAFGLNDVPDGSRVELLGDAYHSGRVTLQNGREVDAAGNVMLTPGTWQKGRAVDAKGNVFWTPESLGGIATNKPPESGRTGGTDKPTPAGKK